MRGVNTIQLMNDGKRWWIVSLISGERLIEATASPPSRLRTAAVSIAVSGHSELTPMPSAANSALMPSVHIDMPNLAIV